ncbi:MAG TPA: HAMP domain-containing sensor histidine kinase [Vicinamibacterales bacterium]|nr:HAMP domain-containing sensor histidine kinase [Vicinamibacterales bacterium]
MEQTSGPTALSQVLQDRSLRLAAALAIAVAIPVAVLFYFQFRSLGDLETTSTVVLQQLSHETADSLTNGIDEELKAPYIRVLLRIAQARTEPLLDLPWIDPVFAESVKHSPFIDEYYVWSGVSSDTRLLVYDRDSASRPAGARFRHDVELEHQLVPRLRELAAHRRVIVTMQESLNGRPRYVQAQLRFNNPARDELTSFVGFSVDPERLRQEYLPLLLRGMMKGIQGPTGFPPLVVTLVDDTGRVIFDSGAQPTRAFIDERKFPLIFFDSELLEYAAPLEMHREIWRLHVGYGDQSIAQIVRANTRPQIILITVLAIGMAGGVLFVAIAAAREMRLAELRSNFVSSVSHDLKTPLALIQLFAETLEVGRVKSTERAYEYYRIINSEARKLTRLIDNILDFSKIEAGLRPYQVGQADLVEVTRRVLARLGDQFTHHRFQVHYEQGAETLPVTIDDHAVEQAIENLLTNAMKYSGASRDIFVRVGVDEGQASVAVTDRGIGIPRRHQRRIFRKFYRIATDATGPQGCGLGLAIVEHIMRAHGGRVRVESEPGHGSTFTLSFPLSVGVTGDGAHSGDRGRAADAARTA